MKSDTACAAAPTSSPCSNGLRQFSSIHIGEDCRALKGRFENALFNRCRFGNLNDLELINCVLFESTFESTEPSDALRFSVTLDCNTFNGIQMSSQFFDLLLLMLCKTKGNDEKRQAIVDHVIGRKAAREMFVKLSHLE